MGLAHRPTRRDFLKTIAGAGALLALPAPVVAQQTLPARSIPSTGEALPIVGLDVATPI